MGYRSDVVLAVRRNKLTPELVAAIEEVGKPDDTCHDDEVLRYKWEYVKWYGWEEGSLESLLDCMEPEDFGLVRVGESIEDAETMGDYWELGIDMSREVIFI